MVASLTMWFLSKRTFVLLGIFIAAFFVVYGIRSMMDDTLVMAGKNGKAGACFHLISRGPVEESSVRLLAELNREYAIVTTSVVPSVVSLDTVGVVKTPGNGQGGGYKVRGLGSGIIVSEEGHIITNNHVIEGKQTIRVTLWDGRSFIASKVGEDKVMDLAVLKINAGTKLQGLPFGDSDTVELGEIVFAVGNPFGLGETVTRGIISAKQRSYGDLQSELLQTDAAINPGNSGGPLVNIRGEIIGINAAVYANNSMAQNTRSQGLGFSIPSNLVKEIFMQICERGKPIRGYIGVALLDPTPQVRELLQYEKEVGVAVNDLHVASPASKSGLKPGDIIIDFNGKSVSSARELLRLIHTAEIGKKALLKVWRRGKEFDLKVDVIEAGTPLPEGALKLPNGLNRLAQLGVRVRNVTLEEYALGARGVVVTYLEPNTEAANVLVAGDLVQGVDGEEVLDVNDLEKGLERGRVTVSVLRGLYALSVRIALPVTSPAEQTESP